MEVHRRELQTRPDARGPHLDELRPVAAHERHAVTRLQSEAAQGIRQPVGVGVELGEGPVAVLGGDRERVGLAASPIGDRHAARNRPVEVVEQLRAGRLSALRHTTERTDDLDDGPPVPCSPVPRLRALLQLARPKQWVKNLLVFAAPGAAGVLGHGTSFVKTVVAFVAFSLAASGTYAWNDARDVEADRRHPKKCNRPVASGAVSVMQAQVFGAILFVAALLVALLATFALMWTVLVYVGLTLAYSLRLKHEPVLDLVTVAACYVIRTVGGATATSVRVSTWFLIVAAAGSLFVVTGKRSAEATHLGADAALTRRALAGYTHQFLLYVRGVSSSVTILAYCLWAFEFSANTGNAVWFQSSIVPFVVGILRYALLLEAGEGGAPEDLLLSDPVLVAVGLAWAGVFAVAVYYK